MESTNKALIQEFYTTFQAAQADLLARVNTLKAQTTPSQDDVNALALDIAKLRRDSTDATSFLPAYDQRQYEQGLKSLEQTVEDLRSSSTGKPKFSFKRKPQKPTSTVSTPALSHQEPSSIPTDALQTSNSVTLSGRTHQYLSWSCVSSMAVSVTDLSIFDLDGCVVNLLVGASNTQPLIFTALHMRNVKNSVLLLPFIQGSALIHDMSNSVIVLGCHQFRMHTSSQADIYLSIDSNPVIEHCSNLSFAHYPDAFRHANISQTAQHGDKLAVQDFSHIRATPSPNWSILEPECRVSSEAWQKAVAITSAENVNEALKQLLPQRGTQ